MGIFASVLIAVLVLITVILFIVSRKVRDTSDEDLSVYFRGAGIAALVVTLIVLGFSTVSYVNARTVGIVTSFGKAVRTVGPGMNMTWPWEEITTFSTGNQTIDFDGTDGNGSPVGFKLAGEVGGGEATVHVNLTWQVQNDDKAVKLWENWKEFDRVKDQLVDKNSRAVIAGIMGRYSADDANKGANLAVFSEEIKKNLNTFFSDKGILVETVAVMRVDFSPQVQDRINKKYSDQQDIERAKIQQERARIEADTNTIRQQNLTPQVLQLQCLEISKAWNDDNNGQLPGGWNCFSSPVGSLSVK
jgi:regulator of protease activity HflC (stomatin/prohibitin superfamily)